MELFGWKIEGEKPQAAKFVMIAAPHTSNWDFPLLILFAAAFDVKISWLAKHSLFKPPMGFVMRALGGVPVVRHENQNMVDAMAQSFDDHDELAVVVPAEGTRARSEYWKSGFYHIAVKANVPIIPSYLDFGHRRGGFGPALVMSGSIPKDMDVFREFYAPMSGKFPEQFGPVRLREESDQ